MPPDPHASAETRRNVLDWLAVESVSWTGRLAEETFLGRVADLDELPSTDVRFQTARQDIRQHRVHNDDWEIDWVYSYAPLSLVGGSDETFFKFVCALIHPVVRPDTGEARRLASEINDILRPDGIELYEGSSIGSRPVWSVRTIGGQGRGRVVSSRVSSDDGDLDDALARIWDGMPVRLFLSHVSAHNVEVSQLKQELGVFHVGAFVAHEDIEPTREWESEIMVALATMNTLAAIITPEFHLSNWTDHEVGVAIGRGVFVLPVRAPTTPYGFMARIQALPGHLAKPRDLAAAIVGVLLKRSETSHLMHEALTLAIERSGSFASSKIVISAIVTTNDFTAAQLRRMAQAIDQNGQVGDYFGVGRLKRYMQDHQT